MKKITCGIVQDLLLSYQEGLTGESVSQMVQEHLLGCPKCRQRFGEIKKLQELAEYEEASRAKSFVEKLKGIRYYMIGILIGLLLPIVLLIVLYAINALGAYFETMVYSYFW